MRQQVIIPWRDAGCTYRRHHFEFLVDYYSQEFDVVIGDNEGDFNRSAARNEGVRKSNSPIAVVIDADNFIPHQQIHHAIWIADKRNALVKPFQFFGYLTEEATDIFYQHFGISEIEPMFIDPPQEDFTGGAYVMKKEIWEGIGGMDEGFIGWGAEDDAFHLLVEKKVGPVRYLQQGEQDWHLYHPAHRVTSGYNYNKLMTEYVNGNKPS